MGADLSPLASDPAATRGRRFDEPPSRSRTVFARDRDRVIHCTAFRRLKGKTQVFVAHDGDHYRTRLTHSLEVAQIARSLAAALKLDVDLAEALALAHDLGHPPFGHAGEDVLRERMASFGDGFGGFDHNVQTFRILTRLEERYPAFPGLNLSWETLEGVVKHNGPVAHLLDQPAWRAVADYAADWDLDPAGFSSLEAQVAAVADDIAYNNHDVDDGVQAGLFGLDELAQTPLIGPLLKAARADWPQVDDRMVRLEAVRRMIGLMIDDVLEETRRRIAETGVETATDVRRAGRPLVGFSQARLAELGEVRRFLFTRMYRHETVNQMRDEAAHVLGDLFDRFIADPGLMSAEWSERARADAGPRRARAVCDYIAGMTDRYALAAHAAQDGRRPGVLA